MRRAMFAFALASMAASPAAAQAPAPDLTALLDRSRLNDAAFLKAPVGLESDRLGEIAVKSWPRALSFSSETLEFEVAPRAGLGVSERGRGAAAGGATLVVSPKTRAEQALDQLRDLGVRDGAHYGDAGRWYFFVAASGQAVGLNMTKSDRGGWDRAGWSTDATASLVGDAQVGVGWRKGDLQSSFGVIHREVKGRHMVFGQETRDDTVAAFTFSVRPTR